jgi:trimethylamine:corrinoid methyltransferase-like protein
MATNSKPTRGKVKTTSARTPDGTKVSIQKVGKEVLHSRDSKPAVDKSGKQVGESLSYKGVKTVKDMKKAVRKGNIADVYKAKKK